MKIKYSILIMISGLFVFHSCDLDRYPESDLSDAIYWQNENDFMQACNYLYTNIFGGAAAVNADYFLSEDQMSDNIMPESSNSISNGTYLPTSDFGPWGRDYRLIRAANKIIEQARSSKLSYSILSRYIAEARFFRAYAYQDLVRRYGDVPLILKTLDVNSDELYLGRTFRETVIDTIYNDLNYAAEFLPAKSKLKVTQNYGRVTSGAALNLKSRVALREGTWVKFHNPANAVHNYTYHLEISKQAALDVINSKEYSLFKSFNKNSYKYLFQVQGEGPGNPEAIFVYIYGFSTDNNVNGNKYSNQVSRGLLSPTRSLVDAYLCIDGLPIDKSPLYQGQVNASSEFIDRDYRLDGIIVQKGETPYIVSNSLFNIPYILTVRSATGYFLEKYISTDDFLDHIIMRYAEVLLNYAEATYELNNSISDADLDISVNLLRARAGVAALSNAFIAANDLNMREEIRRERRVELAIEGFRYDDLLRWKTAETELPKALEGARIFAAEYADTDVKALNLTQDSILIAEPANKRVFDPSKNYLWPIPLNQISLNKNLEQNPNWE